MNNTLPEIDILTDDITSLVIKTLHDMPDLAIFLIGDEDVLTDEGQEIYNALYNNIQDFFHNLKQQQ